MEHGTSRDALQAPSLVNKHLATVCQFVIHLPNRVNIRIRGVLSLCIVSVTVTAGGKDLIWSILALEVDLSVLLDEVSEILAISAIKFVF